MESGQKAPRRGRKLGSSRRRQTREPADGQDTPAAPAPEPWPPQADAELRGFFSACGAADRGFVTRQDLEEAAFSFLGSGEPQMIFDWTDVEQRGQLSLEEFSSGLKSVFGSSPSAPGLRGRPRPSPRASGASVTASLPGLEEAEAEGREALLGQQWSGHLPAEPADTRQLWGRLRQEQPGLAGDLESVVAAVGSRLQDVRAEREALEHALRRRDADHQAAVQRLYEEMEQQISRERQQLQAQSDSRGLALSSQMEEALEAKEEEAQRLAEGQRELEAELHRLGGVQEEAAAESRTLREAEQGLAGQLRAAQGQLRAARRRLAVARARVSWQVEERSPSDPGAPQDHFPEAGDGANGGQPPSSWQSPPHGAPQLSWSPPPTPRAAQGPPARAARQISISDPLSGRAPPPDPGVQCGTQDADGVHSAGQDTARECPWGSGSLGAAALRAPAPLETAPAAPAPAGRRGQLPAAEPDPRPGPDPAAAAGQPDALQEARASPEPGPASPAATVLPEGARCSPGLRAAGQAPAARPELGQDGLQEGRPASPREAGGHVLRPEGLSARSRQSPEAEPKARGGKPGDAGGQDLDAEEAAGAPGLEPGPPPQQDPLPPPAPGEAEAPPKGSAALGARPGAAAGPQEPEPARASLAERQAQPTPPAPAGQAQAEGAPARAPRTERRPEAPGDIAPDPDYLFHVVFLGDSSVGKTSFLHLLHQNTFATRPSATVGVDFRVKTLLVDNKCFALQLWDTAGQERYHSVTRQLLRKADGAVLMYDVTAQESFAHLRYWLHCLQDAGAQEAAILLLGNKSDLEEQRQVPTDAGRQLAQELGVSFAECSSVLGHNILEPMVSLARSLRVQEERLRGSLVAVAPERPPRRAGCCS